jgi:hypothetical protein
MEGVNFGEVVVRLIGYNIIGSTDLDVFPRKVVRVDQHLADLVGGIGILTFLGVVIVDQEVAVAVFDDRLRVGLNLGHHP